MVIHTCQPLRNQTTALLPNLAIIKPDAGPCFGNFPRFHYDGTTSTCKMFTYGGCLGNSNRFRTLLECNEAVEKVRKEVILWTIVFNTLKADPGPCFASIPNYYYDNTAHECKRFLYGGCKGNANRFATLKQCTAISNEISFRRKHWIPQAMNLPPDKGPCYAHIPMYYYDYSSNICKKFIYGGCKGNGNRFSTIQDCEAFGRATRSL